MANADIRDDTAGSVAAAEYIIEEILDKVAWLVFFKPKPPRIRKPNKSKRYSNSTNEQKKLSKKRKGLADKSPAKVKVSDNHAKKLKSKAKRLKGAPVGTSIDKWWHDCLSESRPSADASQTVNAIPLRKQTDDHDQGSTDTSYDTINTYSSANESGAEASERVFLEELHNLLLEDQRIKEKNGQSGDCNKECSETINTKEMQDCNDITMEMVECNPQTMDITMVKTMFDDLKKKVDDVQQCSAATLQNITEAVRKELQSQLSGIHEQQNEKIEKLTSEVNLVKHKNKVLTNVVDSFYTEFKELEQRLQNVEVTAAKRSIIVKNLAVRSKKWEKIQDLYDLFNGFLELDVIIEDVSVMGSQTPPNLIVSLQSMEHKRRIMSRKSWLQELDVGQGKPVYINEYFAASSRTKQRRLQDIFDANKSKEGTAEHLAMEFVKGNLKIQNEVYKKKVAVPTPRELVDLPTEQLKIIMKMDLKAGREFSKEGSRFMAFTAPVANHRTIRDMYIKMKLVYPSARHIVCAYNIPGAEPHYNQDFEDCGEPGAGKELLEMLLQNNIGSRVIFVTRFCGSLKLSGERF